MAEEASTPSASEAAAEPVTRAEFSDTLSRLSELDSLKERVAKLERSGSSSLSSWERFTPLNAVLILDESPTASTDWAELPIGDYVPEEAQAILIHVSIDDTTDGAGESSVSVRFGLTEWKVCSVYEPTAPDFSSGVNTVPVPRVTERIDYKATLTGGSVAGMDFKVYLYGYWT